MISVAMTTYNGERYVKEQVESILRQTYRDFELIICDDCSKDDTRRILQELSSADERIKLHFNEKNLGFKKNFEQAVQLAGGEYIAFSDQDDVWTDNHLEVLMESLGDHDISCADALYVDYENNSMNRTFKETLGLQVIPEPDDCFLRIFFNANFVQGASMLMRAEFAKKLLPIPEKIPYHDCWYAMNASLSGGIVFTDVLITRYRQHGNNVTVKHDPFERLRKVVNVLILRKGFMTDRFAYLEALKEHHSADADENFRFAVEFIDERKRKRFSRKSRKFLMDNFCRIMTCPSPKNVEAQLLKWKNWVPEK